MNIPSLDECRDFLIRHEKILAIAIIGYVFISTLIVDYVNNGWGDVNNYYRNASSVIDHHLMPYRDDVFEYPPFMMMFFIIPKLLSYDIASYHTSFFILSTIFLVINCILMVRITDRLPSSQHRTLFVIVSWMVFSNNFIFTRGDIFVSAMALFGILLFLDKRYTTSSVLFALATMTKLYPILIFGVLMISILAKHENRTLIRSGVVFLLVCVLVELPFIIADASTAFDYLTYHSDRGLQIQSLISSVFLVYNVFVPGSVTVIKSHYSETIVNTVADTIASYINELAILAMVLFCIWVIIRLRKRSISQKENAPLILVPAIVMLFITFSKVYSAQYLIWIAPLLILVVTDTIAPEERKRLLFAYLGLGLFTYIDETCTYGALCNLEPIGVLVIVMKNLFHIILMVLLMYTFYCHTRKDEVSPSR